MGEVKGCSNAMKWLLIAFNVFFLLIGLAILGLGIWIYVDYGPFLDNLVGISWLNGPILMLVVGVVIVVLSTLGCLGALRENRVSLYVFGSLLILTLALEIAAGVAIYVKRDDVDESLAKSLNETLYDYEEARKRGDDESAVVRAWNGVQQKLECCGVQGDADWESVPSSCCENEPKNCTSPYEAGCYTKVKKFIEDEIIPVGIAVLILAFIQILGIVFAFCVARQIAKTVYV